LFQFEIIPDQSTVQDCSSYLQDPSSLNRPSCAALQSPAAAGEKNHQRQGEGAKNDAGSVEATKPPLGSIHGQSPHPFFMAALSHQQGENGM